MMPSVSQGMTLQPLSLCPEQVAARARRRRGAISNHPLAHPLRPAIDCLRYQLHRCSPIGRRSEAFMQRTLPALPCTADLNRCFDTRSAVRATGLVAFSYLPMMAGLDTLLNEAITCRRTNTVRHQAIYRLFQRVLGPHESASQAIQLLHSRLMMLRRQEPWTEALQQPVQLVGRDELWTMLLRMQAVLDCSKMRAALYAPRVAVAAPVPKLSVGHAGVIAGLLGASLALWSQFHGRQLLGHAFWVVLHGSLAMLSTVDCVGMAMMLVACCCFPPAGLGQWWQTYWQSWMF